MKEETNSSPKDLENNEKKTENEDHEIKSKATEINNENNEYNESNGNNQLNYIQKEKDEKSKSENTFIKEEDIKSSMADEYEAYNLCRKARQITSPSCCLISFFQSKKSRKLEAFYLYNKAGIKYKSCQNWEKAGECFEKCADIKLDLNENALDSYRESYFCYEKCDEDKIDNSNNNFENNKNSNRLFNATLDYLSKKGEFYEAGKLCEEVAKKNEDKGKFKEAIDFYSKAADYYINDNKHSTKKNNCLLKYAELLFIHDNENAKNKVPEIFENIGKEYLKVPLNKYTAKEIFGKALLSIVFFSNEASEGDIYMDKYKQIDESFEESSIYILCKGVIEAFKEKNYNKLQKSIKEYKSICEADNFMVDVFTKLLEKLKNTENNLEDMK